MIQPLPSDSRRIPVLMVAYKKPTTTAMVIEGLRDCAPERVYVALNAPRERAKEEMAKCAAVAGLLERIDWDCEVKVLRRTEHLPVARSYLSACNWFFEQVEVGIVLDDDCVPAPDFFRLVAFLHANRSSFCEIGHVNGMNFFEQGDLPPSASAFFLTRYSSCWGWASWRSEWQQFDPEFRTRISRNELWQICDANNPDRVAARRIFWILDSLRESSLDGPGFPPDWLWTLHLWANNRQIAGPATNLVRNMGIGNADGVTVEATAAGRKNERGNERHSYFNCCISRVSQRTGRLPEQIRGDSCADGNKSFDRRMALIYGGLPLLQRWKFRLGEAIRRLRGEQAPFK